MGLIVNVDEPNTNLFREEALEHAAETSEHRGDVLRLSPTWIRWTYWILLLLVLAGLLFVTIGTTSEYAEGPAVIWFERTQVTATQAGTVKTVVERNAQVKANRQLVSFYRGLPGDSELEWIRAPHDCVVSEVRVKEGQSFLPGDTLLSLRSSEDSGSPSVIALLPARYRPMLEEGMPLRLELAGYPHVYQSLQIDSIGNEAIGPSAIRQRLGQDAADVVAVPSPVVLVKAHLPSNDFVANGRLLWLYHGMRGTAVVRVRSERILVTLVPWLK